VIKPEGMSFNGIAPVYRELLLKLAMSMSKDEIFIRSKTIMDQEKDKKRALLLMGGSKLMNNKNVPKDSSGRIMIQKELNSSSGEAVEKQPPVKEKQEKSLGKLLTKATKTNFLMRRKNSTKKSNRNKVGVTVGAKTTSGSVSRQLSSSRRKRSNLSIRNASNEEEAKKESTGQVEDKKPPLTKLDIGAPMPLVEGAKTEVAKKWMLTNIKDIKAEITDDQGRSGPDSGVTSGGRTMTTNIAEDKKTEKCCSECGYQSSGVICDDLNSGMVSVCSCSMLGTSATPAAAAATARSSK
jgi:hypothetical protein